MRMKTAFVPILVLIAMNGMVQSETEAPGPSVDKCELCKDIIGFVDAILTDPTSEYLVAKFSISFCNRAKC